MDIGKYFSISKKRDLSDNSMEDTDPKKADEATSSSSYSDHDVFEKGLDSSNCKSILFDCLKNLESKSEIFANTNTLKANQIKREKQLTDLAETFRKVYISFLSISTFSKVMFKISRKLVCLGGLYILPTIIGVVLGKRISKKIFPITF